MMAETRLEKVQAAYAKRDLAAMRIAHQPAVISKSLKEEHVDFSLAEVILGGQDGLVNVLGVILGVAAASGEPRIIVAAGLAATLAESASMAAVAYTSTRANAEHYQSEAKRELWEIDHNPEGEKEEIRQIYLKRGFTGELLEKVVSKIAQDKKVWLEVMMAEELKLAPIPKERALRSAVIVGSSAVIGSIIPLAPFLFLPVQLSIASALVVSAITLFAVGAYKAKVTVGHWYRSGLELTVIGLVSALVGYGVGLLFKAPVVP